MTAALPAFLAEAVFYVASGFEQTRAWFSRIGSLPTEASLLWVSALAPYLIFSLVAGTFQPNALFLLAVLTVVFAFWQVMLPRRFAYDVGFLVIAAAPIILRVFQRIYASPEEHIRVDLLGHLMWIRLGVMALFVLRGWNPGAFGFWPRAHEWRTGTLYYALVLAPIAAVALKLHDVRFEPMHGQWWRVTAIALGTFFAFFWVVVLGEELLFRGVIERALLNGSGSPVLAVGVSALLFGAVHLWFHKFPDWRRALVVTVLGIACGIAYLRSGSVRAPMVTHALMITTWRVFFK